MRQDGARLGSADTRSRTTLGVLVATAMLVSACASLAGLTGGGDGVADSGDPDHGAPVDGGAGDAVTTNQDGASDTQASDANADDASPDGPTAEDCGDATLCDDFARTVLIPQGGSGATPWASATCPQSGSSIGVDGSLNIFEPEAGAGGSCYLTSYESTSFSTPLDTVSSFRAEFDWTFDTDTDVNPRTGSRPRVIAVFQGPQAGEPYQTYDGGTSGQKFELDLGGNGTAELILHSSRTTGVPILADDTDGAWVTPNTRCNITIAVDTVAMSATATSICNGVSQSLTVNTASGVPDAGMTGPVYIELGYSVTTPQPAWSVSYDNFYFWATP